MLHFKVLCSHCLSAYASVNAGLFADLSVITRDWQLWKWQKNQTFYMMEKSEEVVSLKGFQLLPVNKCFYFYLFQNQMHTLPVHNTYSMSIYSHIEKSKSLQSQYVN